MNARPADVGDIKRDARENVSNVLLLLFFLMIAFGVWVAWGKIGFQYTHRLVTEYASATAKPASPAASATATDVTTAVGQSGDAYGGANALFAAAVGAFAGWAGMLQYKALKRAQQAYREEREENRSNDVARRKEQFDSLFFQMLRLVREVSQSILTTSAPVMKRQGSAALNAFANTIHKRNISESNGVAPSARALAYHFGQVYQRRPSALGTYFRVLYQTFDLISKARFSDNPDEDAQIKAQYSEIARGQMSEGSVFMLALYGMSPMGYHFVKYIEEFGLLENLLPAHVQFQAKYLEEAYRPRAFAGIDTRFTHEHKPTPSTPKDFFFLTEAEAQQALGYPSNQYDHVGDDELM